MFNKIKSILGLDKRQPVFGKPKTPTGFLVNCKHRDTSKMYEHQFETAEELAEFMETYRPTAHLNYVSTMVYAMYGETNRLIEMHNHLVGNVQWENDRFQSIAQTLGVEITELDVYPNQSSAVSCVARCAY